MRKEKKSRLVDSTDVGLNAVRERYLRLFGLVIIDH